MLGTTLKRKDDNSVWTITGVFNDDWVLTRSDTFSTNIHLSASEIRAQFTRATRTEAPEVAPDSLDGRRVLARRHRALSRLQAVEDGSLEAGDVVPSHDPHGAGDTGDIDPFTGQEREGTVKLSKPEANLIRRMARAIRGVNVRTPEEVFAQQEGIAANREAQKIITNPERLEAWEYGHFETSPAVERELSAYVAARDLRERLT
jgi:hypothetical protein